MNLFYHKNTFVLDAMSSTPVRPPFNVFDGGLQSKPEVPAKSDIPQRPLPKIPNWDEASTPKEKAKLAKTVKQQLRRAAIRQLPDGHPRKQRALNNRLNYEKRLLIKLEQTSLNTTRIQRLRAGIERKTEKLIVPNIDATIREFKGKRPNPEQHAKRIALARLTLRELRKIKTEQ